MHRRPGKWLNPLHRRPGKGKTAMSIDEVDDMADTASSRLVTIAAWLRCNAAAAVTVVHLLAPTLPALLYR